MKILTLFKTWKFNPGKRYVRKIVSGMIFLFLVFHANAQSPYMVQFDTLPYDSTNNEHFLTETKADWSHINDAGKRFFYVKPYIDYGGNNGQG